MRTKEIVQLENVFCLAQSLCSSIGILKNERRSDMRKYENLSCLHENRLKQRAYYIPENEGAMLSLNGIWDFAFYENDFDEDGPLMRAFAAVVTVGLTEVFANKTLFYKCKCCGHVTSEDI